MILLLCYCECFELCVTSVTAVTRHNIFVFPPRKYIVHQMDKNVTGINSFSAKAEEFSQCKFQQVNNKSKV